jgi:tRNA (guanine37-N1)-methyltransferase
MEPASQQSLNQPIDRTRFSDQLAIAGVIVDATKVNVILSKHRQLLYNQKGVRNVYEMPDAEGQRAVLLNPEMSWETLEPLLTQILEVENLPRTTQHITKKYEDYSYFEALKLLLPPEVTTPSGFEVIGHIAHLNLRKDQIPFQFVIGNPGGLPQDRSSGTRQPA